MCQGSKIKSSFSLPKIFVHKIHYLNLKLSLGWAFSSDFGSAPISNLFVSLIAVVENCVQKSWPQNIFLQESFLGRLCTSLRGRLQKRTKTRCTMCEFHILRSTTRRLGCRTFYIFPYVLSFSFISRSTMRGFGQFSKLLARSPFFVSWFAC